jgi:hypothetical protein
MCKKDIKKESGRSKEVNESWVGVEKNKSLKTR